MKFFVSYTTRDNEVTVEILQSFSKRLQNFGNVFIDIIDNNSDNRQTRIIEELDDSDIFLLIESSSTYQSEWVNLELERAKLKDIPIRILSVNQLNIFSIKEMIIEINKIEAQLVTRNIKNWADSAKYEHFNIK